MLKFKQNLAVAAAVLAIINTMVDESDDTFDRFYVEAYANGREQGYCIQGFIAPGKSLGVAFSENRNSDSIVVYVGHGVTDFDMQGNVPCEEVYRKAHYFKYNEHYKAAKFIYETMKKAVEAAKEAVALSPV